MSDSPFIEDDGYTETKYLKAVPGLYPAVRVTFRPIPPTDQAVAIERLQKIQREAGAVKSEPEMAEQIARRMRSWEFVDDNNKPVCKSPEVSAEQILKLKTALFTRLMYVVFYASDGGDRDPFTEADTKPTADKVEADLKN